MRLKMSPSADKNLLSNLGYWKAGFRSGNGTTYFRDGAVYEGDYADGIEHGNGMIRWTYPLFMN